MVESFAVYGKRLEQAFNLLNVKEENKVPAIISCVSPKLYKLLSDLWFSKASETLKYDVIVGILLKHLISAPNKTCERIKFQKCLQLKMSQYKIFLLDWNN